MKRGTLKSLAAMLGIVSWLTINGWAQVNSGSDGSDGAFNPTATNTVINMADHPTGIYQYTTANIPAYVTVTFIPNTNNTPVVWLVQSNVVINGKIKVSGQYGDEAITGSGGPGGYRGGNFGNEATSGQGPGGGGPGRSGGNASYASLGSTVGTTNSHTAAGTAGVLYGNAFLIPLLGGSGGGGSTTNCGSGCGCSAVGGGGGGGAILLAASGTIQFTGGSIYADGGGALYCGSNWGGGGSGGGIRLVASAITGSGTISAIGGQSGLNGSGIFGGSGRVRFDTYANSFGGTINGVFTQGYQPIIIPNPGQGAQLTITSVGGVPVSASPTGQVFTPDAVLSSQQANPIPVVVQCSNIPLNTLITVTVTPVNGTSVSASGYNSSGTQTSSTATVLIALPTGGGIIYATAAVAQ